MLYVYKIDTFIFNKTSPLMINLAQLPYQDQKFFDIITMIRSNNLGLTSKY